MRILLLLLFMSSQIVAMKRSITDIAQNPQDNPLGFFSTIDERIIDQVHKARIACQERSTHQLQQHLKNIIALLAHAECSHDYVLEGYPTRGPLANNTKRKKQFESDANQTMQYTKQLKRATEKLAVLFGPDTSPPSDQEWRLINKLFATGLPSLPKKYKKSKFLLQ